jgi:hypothetical protein
MVVGGGLKDSGTYGARETARFVIVSDRWLDVD